MSEARFIVSDVFQALADIPDGSIDLLVTSPPFLALRSYLPADHHDKGKEIGSEATPADFLTTLLALTVEWRRVLAPHGSLCVELGDTYAGSGARGGDYLDEDETKRTGATEHQNRLLDTHVDRDGDDKYDGQRLRDRRRASHNGNKNRDNAPGWPLDKSLCLLPTLYPASLAYGRNLLTGEPCEPWRVRNQIVWHRPNPAVGRLGDKVRPSTSYITVACIAKDRWFDLDAERGPYSDSYTYKVEAGQSQPYRQLRPDDGSVMTMNPAGAPPLDCWLDTTTDDVWTLSTQPYKGSHYATFPITLPRKLINLMCPRQVCTICGEPRRRITDVDYEPLTGPRKSLERRIHESPQVAIHEAVKHTTTLGWTDCGHDTWRRGIVLDPFGGSATTGLAAAELGRDSILIDLDERNLELARQRLGLFLVEGDSQPVGPRTRGGVQANV